MSTEREGLFEAVHTVTDYYDGPREGIADLGGRPHHYKCEWSEEDGNYTDTFVLSPVDQDTFALAQEDWAIWCRWDAAFKQGHVDPSSHPALPEERARHEELQEPLELGLAKAGPAVRMSAEFRVRTDGETDEQGDHTLEVRWTPLA